MTLEELLAMDEIEDMGAWRNDVSTGVADLSAGFEARLAELEEQLNEATKRYQETAARNYELMIAATGEPKEEEPAEEEPDPKEAITDLFKED